MRQQRSRGQSLVEFALVVPVLFFVLVGLVDFMRLIQTNSTVADAARQGARQAIANANATDQPWAAADSNPCQGINFTSGASGHGCLTDTRIRETVNQVMQPFGGSVTLYSNTLAGSCAAPTAGNTSLCIAPAETGAAGAYADCTAAKTALGRDPQPGELGSRKAEWSFPKFKGCFLIQVTVKYTYQPWTPYGPVITLVSSTSMLGEEY